ncbi:MAG TPA: LuxR C-terminal-related transcriptional regulator [Geothrix sp.]|nr:LuxR C-terminal-related transcriptional regulator [Geothrix sp.]
MSLAARVTEEARALFELLERSPDPVFATDRLNRIVAWNKSAERLLGYRADEALGMPCAALMEGCDTAGNRYCTEHCPLLDMATRSEVVRRFELRLRPKEGPPVIREVNIVQLAVAPPHHFYLLHTLKPSDRENRGGQARDEGEAARSPVVNAKESLDARARKLTQREVEILGLVAAGRTSAEIASLLHISALTVRHHTQNILDKLEVHSKAEAVAFAFQKRLV